MKRMVCLILSSVITVLHLAAYADTQGNTAVRPLDLYEKMEIGWAPMVKPVQDIFKSESEIDKFMDVLFKRCAYDEEKNVVSVSLVELYAVCIVTLKEINDNNIADAQKDKCMEFAIAVTANVLGKEELLARHYAAIEEEDSNAIYEITESGIHENYLQSSFFRKLRDFIVTKYCTNNAASISCAPKPLLKCDMVKNTKYLERDLELMCNNSNWKRYYDKETGMFTITLK